MRHSTKLNEANFLSSSYHLSRVDDFREEREFAIGNRRQRDYADVLEEYYEDLVLNQDLYESELIDAEALLHSLQHGYRSITEEVD